MIADGIFISKLAMIYIYIYIYVFVICFCLSATFAVGCYDAAVVMKKKKGYVLQWRGRAGMSNKLWKSKDKKMVERWKKCLRNMPAGQYEKLFPDMYNWVKKFATKTTMKKGTQKKKKTMNSSLAGVKMWQVCRKMKFRGALQDFSMWACLFGDLAFTQVTVEELEGLVPFMKTEIKKFRQEHKWWPHPAVLMHIARKVRKQHLQEEKKRKKEKACQQEEVIKKKMRLADEARGTKREAGKMNEWESGHKHVYWHDQSQCWRALVKKTREGGRHYEHFQKLKNAVKASSDGLGIPVPELKKAQQGGDEKKMASLYDGVFFDNRKSYKHKWMAVVYVKKHGNPRKVWKSLGHFDTMLLAAKAVAKAKKTEVREIRKSKKAIYNTRIGKDLAEQRFMILSSVWVNNRVGKKQKLVPANPPDYEKSEMLMKNPAHQNMFREEPVMEEASIGLKYGPPRDDLLQAWKKTKHSVKYWGTLATKLGFLKDEKVFRKLRIVMTLQNVAKMLHKKDCSLWVKNTGRFVSKHLGPVMFLKKNGLVKKVQKKGNSGKKK